MESKTQNPLGSEAVQVKLREARVARLATVDRECRPHVVPVCFVYDGRALYTALDLKPKRTAPKKLARVRHIQKRPDVTLLLDEYQENWANLWYILIRGKATLVEVPSREYQQAHSLLRSKYPQYAAGLLPETTLLIRILPTRVTCWGKL